MYDTFRNMMNDIFNNPDFTEVCYVNGIKYICIASSVQNGMYFSEAGLQDTVNFTLDLQVTQQNKNNLPRINDRIQFRHKIYKISHIETDSALSTIKLFLVSNSRGK